MVPSLLVVKSDSLYFALHPGFTKVFFSFHTDKAGSILRFNYSEHIILTKRHWKFSSMVMQRSVSVLWIRCCGRA